MEDLGSVFRAESESNFFEKIVRRSIARSNLKSLLLVNDDLW